MQYLNIHIYIYIQLWLCHVNLAINAIYDNGRFGVMPPPEQSLGFLGDLHIWRLFKMGVPSNHPLEMGFSTINHASSLGYTHLWKLSFELTLGGLNMGSARKEDFEMSEQPQAQTMNHEFGI